MIKQKLPHKLLSTAVVSFGMALTMSAVISLGMLYLNSSQTTLGIMLNKWLPIWQTAFILAWPVAFICTLILVPQLFRFSGWLLGLLRKFS